MKAIHYMIQLSFLLLLTGCITLGWGKKTPDTVPDPSKALKPVHTGMQSATKALNSSNKALSKSAKAVRTGAAGAEAGAVAGDVDKVRKEAEGLRTTADEIDSEVLELVKVHSELGSLIKQIKTADMQSSDLKKLYERCRKDIEKADKDHTEQIAAYEEQIAEISTERDKALHKALLLLMGGSIIVIGVCVAAAINGSNTAISVAAAAIVCLIIANTMRTYHKVSATAGGVCIVMCVCLMIYKAWRHRMAENALEETVHSVEAVKDSLTTEDRTKIFGHGALPGALHGIQSSDTMKLVNEKRLKLRPMLEHTLIK